jgi:hypothetical protein
MSQLHSKFTCKAQQMRKSERRKMIRKEENKERRIGYTV